MKIIAKMDSIEEHTTFFTVGWSTCQMRKFLTRAGEGMMLITLIKKKQVKFLGRTTRKEQIEEITRQKRVLKTTLKLSDKSQ